MVNIQDGDCVIVGNDYRLTDKGEETLPLSVEDNELVKQVKRVADELVLSNHMKLFNMAAEQNFRNGGTYGEVLDKANEIRKWFELSIDHPYLMDLTTIAEAKQVLVQALDNLNGKG